MHSKLLAITPLILNALAVPAPAATGAQAPAETDTRRDLSLSPLTDKDLGAVADALESQLPKSSLRFAAEKRGVDTVVGVLDNLLAECSPLVNQIGASMFSCLRTADQSGHDNTDTLLRIDSGLRQRGRDSRRPHLPTRQARRRDR